MKPRMRWSWAGGLPVILSAFVVAFAPLPAVGMLRPAAHRFRIEASQFSYSPSVLSVNPGDTVTVEFVSKDVAHGFYVDGYGVSVQADPGQTRSLTFVADRPGSFRIRCDVTCGAMHPFMIGRLNVGQDTILFRSIGLALIGVVGVLLFAGPASEVQG